MLAAARTASRRLRGLQLCRRGSRSWRLSSTPGWESSSKSVCRKQWVAVRSLSARHPQGFDDCSLMLVLITVLLPKRLQHITDYIICSKNVDANSNQWFPLLYKWVVYSYLLQGRCLNVVTAVWNIPLFSAGRIAAQSVSVCLKWWQHSFSYFSAVNCLRGGFYWEF